MEWTGLPRTGGMGEKTCEKYSAIQWHIGYLLGIKPETMN